MGDPCFDKDWEGKPIRLYTLRNGQGMTCDITNYGGRVVRLLVPDRDGNFDDIVLGFDSIDEYLNTDEVYFGAVIGRVANRISRAEFVLNGRLYQLHPNDGRNHIHGGCNGFHRQVWQVAHFSERELVLDHHSPDGEEGYPGNLEVGLTYALTDDNALHITYTATTDRATPVSITNHSYFNLDGATGGSIMGHRFRIDAPRFTPIGKDMIPTGEVLPVADTRMDFRKPTCLKDRLAKPDIHLKAGLGYDHNFVLEGEGLRLVARVDSPASGRVLEVLTDEPCMQFYSGNFLDGHVLGKGGRRYGYRSAFCLETQRFPNSVNLPEFPGSILHPAEEYRSTCIYRFGTD